MHDIWDIISSDICVRVYLEGRWASSFSSMRAQRVHDEGPGRVHVMLSALVDNPDVCPFCSATLTPVHSLSGSFDGTSSETENQDSPW